MEMPRDNADFIALPLFLNMDMEDISIKRRLNMVRSLREAGLSFDEIVGILRLNGQCAGLADLRANQLADDGDGQHAMQTL